MRLSQPSRTGSSSGALEYEAILKRAGDDRLQGSGHAHVWREWRETSRRRSRPNDRGYSRPEPSPRPGSRGRERRVAAAARWHARAFSARGYVQASTEMIDGRKLYILIANDGSTIAYLDVPPGLDIDPLLAHRVGVRGEPHFNEDLGARLITVRDVEKLGIEAVKDGLSGTGRNAVLFIAGALRGLCSTLLALSGSPATSLEQRIDLLGEGLAERLGRFGIEANVD